MKMIYIGKLLFIASVNLARLSIIDFIGLLAVSDWITRLNRIIFSIVSLWTVIALFAFAFQCQLPLPWNSEASRCIDQV